MTGVSHDRALWLSKNILPHEDALRAWLKNRRVADLEIDDIVQEAYAKICALEFVEGIRHPKTYFFRTAYSIIVTHIRRSRVVSIFSVENMDALSLTTHDPSPERQVADREELSRIAAAIASLPNACREVFTLRRIEGLSQRDVAKRLKLTENSVEHHMTKAIRFMMEKFGRGGKPELPSSIGSILDRVIDSERKKEKPTD
jgi:RNA polymerase sigma-70 factor (ECF subfamily)